MSVAWNSMPARLAGYFWLPARWIFWVPRGYLLEAVVPRIKVVGDDAIWLCRFGSICIKAYINFQGICGIEWFGQYWSLILICLLHALPELVYGPGIPLQLPNGREYPLFFNRQPSFAGVSLITPPWKKEYPGWESVSGKTEDCFLKNGPAD